MESNSYNINLLYAHCIFLNKKNLFLLKSNLLINFWLFHSNLLSNLSKLFTVMILLTFFGYSFLLIIIVMYINNLLLFLIILIFIHSTYLYSVSYPFISQRILCLMDSVSFLIPECPKAQETHSIIGSDIYIQITP